MTAHSIQTPPKRKGPPWWLWMLLALVAGALKLEAIAATCLILMGICQIIDTLERIERRIK